MEVVSSDDKRNHARPAREKKILSIAFANLFKYFEKNCFVLLDLCLIIYKRNKKM